MRLCAGNDRATVRLQRDRWRSRICSRDSLYNKCVNSNRSLEEAPDEGVAARLGNERVDITARGRSGIEIYRSVYF